MRISIITACYNSASTIGETVESFLGQTHEDREYILVDGGSKDGTVALVQESLKGAGFPYQIIAGPDRGMYDAMRKGIEAATGDVVAILNSDDALESPDVLAHLARKFAENPAADIVIADVVMVRRGRPRDIVRFYDAEHFQPSQLLRGIMPPHAGFYAKRDLFRVHGSYDPAFRYAGDFELMVRFFLKASLTFVHVPEVVVRMQLGGMSNRTLMDRFRLNREILHALRQNGFRASLWAIATKIPGKLFQYLRKPRRG